MKKLEYYIIKIFQEMKLKENFETRYVIIEDSLLSIIKSEDDLGLYVKTEMILDGRSTKSFKFEKIIDGLYKVIWTDLFYYIIGEKERKDLSSTLDINKEIELIKVSSTPLSSYIKTL